MDEKISILEGKVMLEVTGKTGGDQITFKCDDGLAYALFHRQSCCESVVIDDICGDLQDLVGVPILIAEEVTNNEHPFNGPHGDALLKAKLLQGTKEPDREYVPESETWTFYKFRTIKGSVDIRWHGSSNGYYSEAVTFSIL